MLQRYRTGELILFEKGEVLQDVYIGEIEVADHATMPINILFRAQPNVPLLVFDRVSFIKQKQQH